MNSGSVTEGSAELKNDTSRLYSWRERGSARLGWHILVADAWISISKKFALEERKLYYPVLKQLKITDA